MVTLSAVKPSARHACCSSCSCCSPPMQRTTMAPPLPVNFAAAVHQEQPTTKHDPLRKSLPHWVHERYEHVHGIDVALENAGNPITRSNCETACDVSSPFTEHASSIMRILVAPNTSSPNIWRRSSKFLFMSLPRVSQSWPRSASLHQTKQNRIRWLLAQDSGCNYHASQVQDAEAED